MFETALMFGLRDSYSPSALAALVVFLIILSVLGKDRWSVFIFGSIFIVTVFAIRVNLIVGGFDSTLAPNSVMQAIRIAYMIIGSVFIFLGCLAFRDWWVFKRKNSEEKALLGLPVFLTNKESEKTSLVKKVLNFLVLFCVSIVVMLLAAGMTFIGSIWYRDYSISTLYYFQIAESGMGALPQWVLIAPVILFVFPLIVVWLWILLRKSSPVNFSQVNPKLSIVRITMSAILLSVGLGLLYAFSKTL